MGSLMEMDIGDVTPMTSATVLSQDGDLRMTYKAKSGQRLVFMFLGTEPKNGSRPLDAFGILNALGWTFEESKDRVLFRVEAVRDGFVEAVIPSWDPDKTITVPFTRMTRAVVDQLKDGVYLLGLCNLGAKTEDELCIARINEALRRRMAS